MKPSSPVSPKVHNRRAALLPALLLASLLPAASADILTLRNGKRVEGCVTAESEAEITVQTTSGEVIVKVEDLYARVSGDDLVAQYEARASRVTARVGDQLSLARWCKLHCMDERAKVHAAKILARSPSNAKAREILGYTRNEEGAWVGPDGGADEFAKEKAGGSGTGTRRTTGGARSPAKEFNRRWKAIDKSDAQALRDLAFYCRSEQLSEQALEVLRALFAIVPDDSDGLRLAEYFKIDRGLLTSAGMSDTTLLEMRDGKELLGKVTSADRAYLTIRIAGIGRIEVPLRDVRERKLLTLEERDYFDRREKLTAGDMKGHLQLALWCEEEGLTSYARKEAEFVVGIEKDSKEARRILGHVWKNKQWVAMDGGRRLDDLDESNKEWLKRRKEIEARCQSLLELIRTGSKEEAAQAVNEALEITHPPVVPILVHVLVEERANEDWLKRSKQRLYEMQTVKIVSSLQSLAGKSRDPGVIKDCIEVLGRMINEESGVALVELLIELDSIYHDDAFEALGKMSAPAVDRALILGCKKTTGRIRERIINLCGISRSAGTVPALLRYMTARNPFKDASYFALVQIGYPAVPALVESLKNRDLRKQTVRVLREITGETIAISHPRWKAWWDSYSGR